MALVAGYAYHHRDFETERLPLRRQDINFGVAYNNALPFSPRTTFRFMMGSTALSRATERGLVEAESTFLRMIGRAELDHQLNQTWHVGAFYHRGIQYIEGISDVFLADSVTAQLRGYLGPRVEVRGTLGYSTGPLRYGPEQRAYDTAAATARVRMAIHVHLKIDYLAAANSPVTLGAPSDISRTSSSSRASVSRRCLRDTRDPLNAWL